MIYFSVEELCDSSIAKKYKIDNTPSEEIRANLVYLIDHALDPLRKLYGKPIIVNSGYRCPKLNAHPEIKGSKTSDHLKGFAADIYAKNLKDNKLLFELAKKLPMFDQLINEKPTGLNNNPNWIHISCRREGNRKEILLYKNGVYKKIK